ncbi:MAG: hypothetical protein M0R33_17250 [Methylomonas sp.]|jgi:hypothetical protein|uniref:hypothetical protein n=1 Tax=Methylomonas sp. TaxID=418 RepID=UPI0025F844E0|nr:hypothetical protein [Methylomonas sp.]MCK9608194.1 hypothetical protein [Methylomonas sp.]
MIEFIIVAIFVIICLLSGGTFIFPNETAHPRDYSPDERVFTDIERGDEYRHVKNTATTQRDASQLLNEPSDIQNIGLHIVPTTIPSTLIENPPLSPRKKVSFAEIRQEREYNKHSGEIVSDGTGPAHTKATEK